MYYDDEYIEYNDYIESVELISEVFSEKVITEVLTTAGLVSEKSPKYSGNMEKLVFVYGNDKEVYSSSEIKFTERIHLVYMYSDFSKSLQQGNMACRVIATKINENGYDAITACVAFEKIVDKALDGYNIFLFVTEDCVFFGCRIFDENEKYDCALSNPIRKEIKFEQILDEFSYTSGEKEFINYYQQVKYIVTSDQNVSLSYEDIIIRQMGIQQSYLDNLDEIGRMLGVDFTKEKARYWDVFNKESEKSFISVLEEIYESLSFIKSNRVNIYEMLFEADEMLKRAETIETENERLALAVTNEYKDEDNVLDDEMKSLLDNPEEMIKLLKKRRGL